MTHRQTDSGRPWPAWVMVAWSGLVFPFAAVAELSSSANYTNSQTSIDGGSGVSSSASYSLNAAFGFAVVGTSTSLNDSLLTGFILALDSDGDGLTDAQELSLGTNLLLPDTDSDGLSDFEEVSGGDPLAYDVGVDTDPNNPDTDADGYSDGLEVAAGTDPLDVLSTFLAVAGDINDDGLVNTADLVLGQRILIGLYSPTVLEQARFDIAPLTGGLPDPDGTTNAGDYVILLRLVTGGISF